MRLGCATVVLGFFGGLLLVLVAFAGLAWFVLGVFDPPDLQPPAATLADWRSAQQKLSALTKRSSMGSGGFGVPGPIILSEREVNAFLDRVLVEVADLPLAGLTVRLVGKDSISFGARVPLGAILTEPPMSRLRNALPSHWLERTVWLHLETETRLELNGGRPRRYLRLDVTRFAIGRRELPGFALRLIVNPATLRLLRSPLPDTIEGLRVEPERVVIRTGS